MSAPNFAELWSTADGASDGPLGFEWPWIMYSLQASDEMDELLYTRPDRKLGLEHLNRLSDVSFKMTRIARPSAEALATVAEILKDRERDNPNWPLYNPPPGADRRHDDSFSRLQVGETVNVVWKPVL